MQLNIVDDKTHRVSDDLHYEVTRLENHPIIVIDDVLENPHAFLEEVVQKLPMQYNDPIVEIQRKYSQAISQSYILIYQRSVILLPI